MTRYLAIIGARFRTLLQYRAAAVAGVVTQLFWGGIRIMIFEAFYRSAPVEQPMSLAQVVTYVWLTQGFLLLLPFRADADLRNMIRTGNVAYELARPVDLYAVWYVRNIAMRTAPVLLRSLPLFAVAVPLLGMGLPPSWDAFGAFCLTLIGAVLVASAIGTLMTISMLWTISGEGLARLLSAVTNLLAGAIVPLPLFPAWAQRVIVWLPFRAVMDTPFRMYTGHPELADVLGALGHQLAWAVALILFGRWVLSRGVRRLEVQGG